MTNPTDPRSLVETSGETPCWRCGYRFDEHVGPALALGCFSFTADDPSAKPTPPVPSSSDEMPEEVAQCVRDSRAYHLPATVDVALVWLASDRERLIRHEAELLQRIDTQAAAFERRAEERDREWQEVEDKNIASSVKVEREACAMIIESDAWDILKGLASDMQLSYLVGALAAAIRARTEKEGTNG